MNTARASLALLVFALAAGFAHAAGPTPPASPREIPLEAFVTTMDFGNPRISPDGTKLAFIARLGTGRYGVALLELATGKVEPLVAPNDRDVQFFDWKDNDLIVFGADPQDSYYNSLRSITLGDRKVRELSTAATFLELQYAGGLRVRLSDWLPACPGKILVRGHLSSSGGEWGYSLLDARTGNTTEVDRSSGDAITTDAIPARDGSIRARVLSDAGRFTYEVRPGASGPFKKVADLAWTEPAWTFLGIVGEDTLYVGVSTDTRKTTLHALDLGSGELGPAILEAPDGRITEIIRSHDWKTLFGAVIEGDKPRIHWFDPSRAKLQTGIDVALPGRINRDVSSSADGRFLVIESASDRDPGTYYLFDRKNPRLVLLGKAREVLAPELMCPMEPFQFNARDGLELHGYVTRPKGFENRPAPLVVFIHRGPFDDWDTWGFGPHVQLFASRGYAVMQVNYRGSAGFGAMFERAGWRELGGKIQDDIADATKWAIQSGIANPEKVALFGLKFGGAAALMSSANSPGLYRCAINYSGVLDYSEELAPESWQTRADRKFDEQRYGSGHEFLISQSPIGVVQNIRVPTLHIYTYNHERPDEKTWKRFRSRLSKNKVPFDEVIIKDSLILEHLDKVQTDIYTKTLAFLDQHMPPDQ